MKLERIRGPSRAPLLRRGSALEVRKRICAAAPRVGPSASCRAELYLLLGDVHSSSADSDELAEACYAKALELSPWGSVAEHVKARRSR